MRVMEYPVELLEAGSNFLADRTRFAKEVICGIVFYLCNFDIVYTEAFFDGFACNTYFCTTHLIPREYGFYRRWKYKRAFKDGFQFRIEVLKRMKKT